MGNNNCYRMNVIQYRQLDTYDEGFAVDLHCLDPVTQSTVVYSTLYGDLGGLQSKQF